jgi:uncharacterized membrane protein YeaQ/YmgE (transglycosylase-associated protein family)
MARVLSVILSSEYRLPVPIQARIARMTEGEIGWVTAIIVGLVAGWMADKFMHTHLPFGWAAVGMSGAFILNAIAEKAGYHWGGWLTYLLLGFFGACMLLIPLRLYIVRTRLPKTPDEW